MADESTATEQGTTTPQGEGTTQTAPAEPSGNQGRTFTQADVDRIVQERLSRAKATPPADYEDLKAKAARLDELEEAQKSDLEKANDRAERAQAEASDWQAKYEALEAERQRSRQVASMAAQYGVDAGTLTRMSGDVEDNAKYLAGLEAARPKFGATTDAGEHGAPAQTLDERLAKAKNVHERIRIRAQWNAEHQKQ